MDEVEISSPLIIQPHKGVRYTALLKAIHTSFKPKTYLEIGSNTGDSLALAACRTIAIDPSFRLNPPFLGKKDVCCLYQIPSDAFFDSYNPEQILGGKIDFAFLDGMHLAEFLLRDFFNTEAYCKNNSIIALHDCIPLDAAMARRQMTGPNIVRSSLEPNWWTGDVWKVVAILQKHRPELRIYPVDAAPTGLIFITNLDPTSQVLKQQYFDILDEINAMTLADLEVFLTTLNIHPSSDFESFEAMSRYLYL